MDRTEGLTLQDPGARSTALVRRVRLRVVAGPDEGTSVEVPDTGVLIGSRAPAELVLSDSNASRRHAEVRRGPNGWVLTDLGSTNGTWIEDLRIEAAYLREGGLFRVGHTTIAFEGREEGVRLRPAPSDAALGVVAASPAMCEVVAAVRQFAPTDLSVVLEGETGVGKEVLARALHRLSHRSAKPCVVVDCGALHEDLTESELFGHERGAFTGAVEARAGAFEEADGGTLFLDEIGELPLSLQPKLLRALEAREVRRLGSNRIRSVDVRVIAATNRDLPAEVAARTFRADLFFRLSEVRVRIPPLRERPDDIVPLAQAFVGEVSAEARFTPEALEVLGRRSWPGNARELGNVVRRAAVAARGAPIGPEHLAPADLVSLPGKGGGPTLSVDVDLPIVEAREAVLAAFNRLYLQALLARFGDDLASVAKHAGVHPNSVHRLLRNAGFKSLRAVDE